MAQSKNDKLLDRVKEIEDAGMNTTKQWYDIWAQSMRYVFSDHDHLTSKHDDWEYIGSSLLAEQDFRDDSKWRQVNLVSSQAEVRAYEKDSSLPAERDLTVHAIST